MQRQGRHSKERKRLPGEWARSEHTRMHLISSSSPTPQSSTQSWLANINDKKDSKDMMVVGRGSWEPEVVAARSFKTGFGVGADVWSCGHWTSSHSMPDVASQQTAVQPPKVAVTLGRTLVAIRGLPLNGMAVIVHPRLTRPMAMKWEYCILRMVMMILMEAMLSTMFG